jgi:putative hemolysin
MKKIMFLAALLMFGAAGCTKIPTTVPATPETGNGSGQTTTMANPASVNCTEKGGKLEIRTSKPGEYGVCLFEDNRQCEEWALMRGECPAGGVKITGYENDAEIFCAITGGEVQGIGTKTPMCKRIDGTLCNAQANVDGDCPDPHDPNPNAGNVEAQ